MEITIKIEYSNKISYSGIKTGKVKVFANNITKEYELYKLMPKDSKFLNDLSQTVDVASRMDGLNELEYELWHNVFNSGLKISISEEKRGFLLADENKVPCGFLRYNNENKIWYVKYVCTWPTEKNKRKLMAGKSMFMQLFKDFLDTEMQMIRLQALKYSAFSPISKYMELGFKMSGGNDATEIMFIKRAGIINALEKFSKKIQIMPAGAEANVNLYNELNLII